MATKKGVVKKTKLSEYKNIRTNGLIAIRLDDNDELMGVVRSNGEQDIMLASSGGKLIRFAETDARAMGRSTRGVTGMRFPEGHQVISMTLAAEKASLLVVSEHGYGKRTLVSEYNRQKRGGQGVFTLKTGDRNGAMVATIQVLGDDQVMMITDTGRLMRMGMQDISVIGRNTQGVTLIKCSKKEVVIGAVRVVEKQDEEEDDDESLALDAMDEAGGDDT